jgi:hypothetical protein
MESATFQGRYGNRSISGRFVTPVRTRTVRIPASMPAITSVSIRSPTIAALSEWASSALRAERIMSGFGLPTK